MRLLFDDLFGFIHLISDRVIDNESLFFANWVYLCTIHEAVLGHLFAYDLVINLFTAKINPAVWFLLNYNKIFFDLILQFWLILLFQMVDVATLNLRYILNNRLSSSLYMVLIAVILIQELQNGKHLSTYHWTHHAIINNNWQLFEFTVVIVDFCQ